MELCGAAHGTDTTLDHYVGSEWEYRLHPDSTTRHYVTLMSKASHVWLETVCRVLIHWISKFIGKD